MKSIILVTLSLVSISAFAEKSPCLSIVGKYDCPYKGQTVVMSITEGKKINSVVIEVDGNKDTQIIDGKLHKSTADDSINRASCTETNELVIENYFHDKKVGGARMSKSENGLNYSVEQNGGIKISFECTTSAE
jgi:hypothetical protein